ncbi:Protein FAM64A [Microtus ochrogaster]|uniref:Protein FAM64A n=1 Tax=Microtus ochrogaster TaxID=79684 RepID=A0A8J6KVX4_MICOH|nr:Protein FAM64A [Microtus ochrogaster]
MRRRSLLKEEHLEKGVTRSAEGHLGSLCRQFQRRLPLRAVSLNLGTGPSWKRLETPEPEQQGLQGAARSAKCALGAMSQSDSDLEPVGAGIQHLQKLSQKLDKAIKAEEREKDNGSSLLQETGPVQPSSHQNVCATHPMNFQEEVQLRSSASPDHC